MHILIRKNIHTLNGTIFSIGSFRMTSIRLIIWSLSALTIYLCLLQPASPLLITLHFAALYTLGEIFGHVVAPPLELKYSLGFLIESILAVPTLLAGLFSRTLYLISRRLLQRPLNKMPSVTYWNIFFSLAVYGCITYFSAYPIICTLASLALIYPILTITAKGVSCLVTSIYHYTFPLATLFCATLVVLTGMNLLLLSTHLTTIILGLSRLPMIDVTSQTLFKAAHILLVPVVLSAPAEFPKTGYDALIKSRGRDDGQQRMSTVSESP